MPRSCTGVNPNPCLTFAGSPTAASAAMTPAALGTAAPAETGPPPGSYNAAEYKHLNVIDEVRDLFEYIGRYKPQTVELETTLKPFIPDYIPAVGGIDEFIKVPRPDGKPDFLGLKVGWHACGRQAGRRAVGHAMPARCL
jgi:hypothetical protein